MRTITVPMRIFFLACAAASLLVACGDSDPPSSPWAGEYSSPHGVSLTLVAAAGGTMTGELVLDEQGSFPVLLHTAGAGLEGTFGDGAGLFPLSISGSVVPGQIVMTSEDAIYELSRVGAVNPLAQPSGISSIQAGMAAADPVEGANFRHPDGYFSMKVPSDWHATMMARDVFELQTGVPGDLVIVLLGDLEPFEIGKPILDVMPGAMAAADGFLMQNAQIEADSHNATAQPVRVGSHQGATSQRPAIDRGNPVTVWQGVVVRDNTVLMLISSIAQGQESRLVPVLDSAFATVRLHRGWAAGDLSRGDASQPLSPSAQNASGRNVMINGQWLSDAQLANLEGATPTIPDGNFWYDRKSGMAGYVGGPTEAYLAPGLGLGGPLSPDASGGDTQIAFNGRYLHPIDVAGLEYYFGEIEPGRYWLDGDGNYGDEGGPQSGNLIEEIAAAQIVASAMREEMQARYWNELYAQVQAYQGGGGGYYDQGGGFYDQGAGGSGSVYSHFANLGASGTGTAVADLGGGVTIVNAGGVLWWPGK